MPFHWNQLRFKIWHMNINCCRYLEYIFTRCTEMGGGAAEFALYLYALETTLYLSRKRRVVVNDNDLKVWW